MSLRCEIAAATATLLDITPPAAHALCQQTKKPQIQTGRRFIHPEEPRREEHRTMHTHPDDIIAPGDIFEPNPADLDALLRRAENPPQHVIESPLELLADRVMLKVDEFADIMRIDISTAYKMIRAGQIEVIRVGENDRGIRVPAQPLARMLGAECPHCGEIGGAR